MGNKMSMNQGRALAVGSFSINFVTQMYGMLAKPNMKEVADAVCPSRAAPRTRFPRSRSYARTEPLRFLTQPLVHRWLLFHPGRHPRPLDPRAFPHGQWPPRKPVSAG